MKKPSHKEILDFNQRRNKTDAKLPISHNKMKMST